MGGIRCRKRRRPEKIFTDNMQNPHDPNEAGYDNVPDANGDNGNGDNQNIAEADKWQPNCTVSKYFRLCLQKV